MHLRRCTAQHPDDEGFALLAVLGSMAVLMMFLLGTLSYAANNLPRSRGDQDAKAAVAAAQAGIEDYLSRLHANPTYWQTTDSSNTAFTTGLAVAGTGGDKGRFTYQVLSTQQEITSSGTLRLRVTGYSRGGKRNLIATMQPDGFLKYVYYTDVEALDPVLYSTDWPVLVNGSTGGGTGGNAYKNYAHVPTVNAMCARYYYDGRVANNTYIASTATPYYQKNTKFGTYTAVTDGSTVTLGGTTDATKACVNIQWVTGDVVDGPMHSNDALQINGDPLFTSKVTQTSWSDTAKIPPSDPNKRWWGSGTPSSSGHRPIFYPPVELPDSNSQLKDVTATGHPGCLYTGATRITFIDNAMKVLSPNTTTAKPECFNTANRGSEQTISPVPAVVYVAAGSSTCTGVGYPIFKEDATMGATPDHSCSKGNAYVSGRLNGNTTIGTDNDIVITRDLTYTNGVTGTDVLGLIANNRVWVYHPVDSSGNNLLSSTEEVHNIQAAILSVRQSFLVQSWQFGAKLDGGGTGKKLNVTGVIAQKFRGPVGQGSSGYIKNYVYDTRLLKVPPPYFLRPKVSPWRVTKTTE
jgi:Tfp pilus assembly protein PilV